MVYYFGIPLPVNYLFLVSPSDTRITDNIIMLSDRRYTMKLRLLESPQGRDMGYFRDFYE